MHCSVAQCLEVVGEWWSMLILRDVFLGVTRFDDFQAAPRDLPQHLEPAPQPPGRRRGSLEGPVQRAPAPLRLPPHRQRARPLARVYRHAPVGRHIRRTWRAAGGGDPQGLRASDEGRHGLFGVRGAARSPRRSGCSRVREPSSPSSRGPVVERQHLVGARAVGPRRGASPLESSSAFVAGASLILDQTSADRVIGHIDLGPDHHTPWGIVHGGVYATAVESAASIGATTR